MNDQAFTRTMLLLLFALCAILLYLDWMRHAEIEGLQQRLDGLNPPEPIRRPVPPTVPADQPGLVDPPPFVPSAEAPAPAVVDGPPAGPQTPDLIRLVLQARSDQQLSTIGDQ